MSSILSPLANVNSSGLRASKSSMKQVLVKYMLFFRLQEGQLQGHLRITSRISPGNAFFGEPPNCLNAMLFCAPTVNDTKDLRPFRYARDKLISLAIVDECM